MKKYALLSKAVIPFLFVIGLCVLPHAASADSGQCASFDASSNTVHIPCFNLGAGSYSLDLGLVSSGLQLNSFAENSIPSTSLRCASFELTSNTLHVPCLDLGESSYWLDMPLIGLDPIVFGISNYGSDAFTQADLTGTWDFVGFKSGEDTGWVHGVAVLDSTGSAALSSYMEDSCSDAQCGPPPGCVVLSIDATGTVTQGGECGNPTFQGSMSSDKALFVATMTQHQNSAQLMVFRKRVAGLTFSSSDVANFESSFFALLTGGISHWVYGSARTDDSGHVTITADNAPAGPITPLPGGGAFLIDSDGIITAPDNSTFYGIMTADKKALFAVDTYNAAPTYRMSVHLLGGQTFTGADLAGTYNFHGLISNTAGAWNTGVFDVDAAGTQTYHSFLDASGSTALPATDLLSLNSDGGMSKPDNGSYHGQMSYNKDLYVKTQGTGPAFSVTIGLKQ